MSDGLILSDICITGGERTVIEVDCCIQPGETVTIMGPSGVGKSTLLAYVTGRLPHAFQGSGRIILNGKDITETAPHKRRIGILFQDDTLFPHLSVGQNLAFGLHPGGNRKERMALVNAALEDVGLKGFYDRDPATLSGGQASRVQLMRVLLSDPKALLLDEAFSRLDATLREQIRSLVFGHIRSRNLPALMVTHDIEDARAAGGPIIELKQN